VIVDDEPDVLRSLFDLFRGTYQVVTFERAKDALAALPGLDPPVVMSDQKMPGISGVEFLRDVRLRAPEATRLLFTGYSDLKTVIDAINEGHIYRYITKPWDTDELTTVVRQAFEQNALRVERRRLIGELQASNARLAESNRLKELFIEVASHELNTPVAVILGMAELWGMNCAATATPSERYWVDRIRQAGHRLARTVERMMHLLQSDRLSETLDLQPTDLAALIERVAGELQPFLDARRQTLRLELEPGLGDAWIDPNKIGDVLTNLVVNGIKFTPDGGTLLVRAAADGPADVRIEVIDSGVGINAADLPYLFEPFFTGHDTRHHSSGEYQFGKRGLGLGLNLVKRFVELHRGSVAVESESARGSTFRVRLPREPDPAPYLPPTVGLAGRTVQPSSDPGSDFDSGEGTLAARKSSK
jgi:signal transduction histidine kinase